MNLENIGEFIALRRKEKNLTQSALAEKLGITDRAVSKWERGKGLPEASLMVELCEILGITVNDLLTGEVVSMDNYNKEVEKNLLEMVKQKEESDKRLLTTEIVMTTVIMVLVFGLFFISCFVLMEDWLRIVIIVGGIISIIVTCSIAIRIEQIAGYYECQKCGHRYVPKYSSVLWAPHINRTRLMKCPKCNERSWQKKVISKEKTK